MLFFLAGKAYGAGNYFARDFKLSYSNYSPPDANGDKTIYQARVLTGFYALGNGQMLTSPDRQDGVGKFHSTVDNMANPTMFVTYLDAMAYPEYIITVR